ncbi:MAG: hypothetical protein ABSB63_21600 [Spirochaetia bacterium]|jgi:hypothetical protein
MPQGRKGRLNFRCPACFVREIDVDMFYDTEKKEYYCLRCPFTGTEAEVLSLNEMAKFRYKSITARITEFD